MKFLKNSEKIFVFLFVILAVAGFSERQVFAADPVTEAECKSLSPTAGACELYGTGSCGQTGATRKGSCEPNSIGLNRICCVPDASLATSRDSCAKISGTCRDTPTCDMGVCSGSVTGCADNETASGNCGTIATSCCLVKTTPNSSGNTSSGSTSLNYTPLENLPGFEGQSGDFATYFKNLYLFALWIVGICALFMLVVGGFLYLSSAGNTSLLGYAKKTIYAALIGLVIALISWLLLNTINSDLTTLPMSTLSGLTGSGGSTAPSVPLGSTPTPGSGSGCGGAETQSGSHCEDATQALSDALKCMVDKLGSKKMQISSISDDSGGSSIFSRCRDNYAQPPCEHGAGSCHYGGKAKASQSCAADISNSYTSNSGAASKDEIKSAARGCGIPFVNDEGDHVHVSVNGCNCDGHG